LPIDCNVTEGDGRQPVDADVDVLRRFLSPRQVEIAAARRSRADEYCIEPFGQQVLHAVDAHPPAKLDAYIEYETDFLVDDFFGQPETRNLAADHATSLSSWSNTTT
jgi:hypothetical protein